MIMISPITIKMTDERIRSDPMSGPTVVEERSSASPNRSMRAPSSRSNSVATAAADGLALGAALPDAPGDAAADALAAALAVGEGSGVGVARGVRVGRALALGPALALAPGLPDAPLAEGSTDGVGAGVGGGRRSIGSVRISTKPSGSWWTMDS